MKCKTQQTGSNDNIQFSFLKQSLFFFFLFFFCFFCFVFNGIEHSGRFSKICRRQDISPIDPIYPIAILVTDIRHLRFTVHILCKRGKIVLKQRTQVAE